MPELIHGKDAVKEMQKMENSRLRRSLDELCTRNKRKFDFLAEDSPAELEMKCEKTIMREVFDGRMADALLDEERGSEGHLITDIELYGEKYNLVVKYYLEKNTSRPYFDSVQLKMADTIYA